MNATPALLPLSVVPADSVEDSVLVLSESEIPTELKSSLTGYLGEYERGVHHASSNSYAAGTYTGGKLEFNDAPIVHNIDGRDIRFYTGTFSRQDGISSVSPSRAAGMLVGFLIGTAVVICLLVVVAIALNALTPATPIIIERIWESGLAVPESSRVTMMVLEAGEAYNHALDIMYARYIAFMTDLFC